MSTLERITMFSADETCTSARVKSPPIEDCIRLLYLCMCMQTPVLIMQRSGWIYTIIKKCIAAFSISSLFSSITPVLKCYSTVKQLQTVYIYMDRGLSLKHEHSEVNAYAHTLFSVSFQMWLTCPSDPVGDLAVTDSNTYDLMVYFKLTSSGHAENSCSIKTDFFTQSQQINIDRAKGKHGEDLFPNTMSDFSLSCEENILTFIT